MSGRRTVAVAVRVLTQLRRDHRTAVMLLLLPTLLLALLRWMFAEVPGPGFAGLGPPLLALLPFTVMFLVTSVTTLRERVSGTLERLLTMPLAKADLLVGYLLAFGAAAALQAGLAVGTCVWLLGLEVEGAVGLLLVVAVLDAVLGAALGLLVSAFARTELQAVQFMPAVVLPQVLLCGLFVDRELLPGALELLSSALPLSYAVDAMDTVVATTDPVAGDLLVVAAFAVAAVVLGAATLRRRTA